MNNYGMNKVWKIGILVVFLICFSFFVSAVATSTAFFIDENLYNNGSIYAVGNYSETDNLTEGGSYGSYIVDGIYDPVYNFSEQRTLWSGYQPFNDSVFYLITNHDGTWPVLNCTNIRENCMIDLGHNTSQDTSSVWNDSAYAFDLKKVYGDYLNLSMYINSTEQDGYVTFWFYVENITTLEYLAMPTTHWTGGYLLRYYFTGSDTDWMGGYTYNVKVGELKSGWNFIYQDLDEWDYLSGGGDLPDSQNTSRIRYMYIVIGTEDGTIGNSINVSSGDWKIGEIKMGKGYPFLKQYEYERDDNISYSYTPCILGAACGTEVVLENVTVLDVPPIQFGDTGIDKSVYVDGLIRCIPGNFFDHDMDPRSATYWAWNLNGVSLDVDASSIDLSTQVEVEGDDLSCGVMYESEMPNGTRVNSSLYESPNSTIAAMTQIWVNTSYTKHSINPWIYGQGNTMKAAKEVDTAFNPATREFNQTHLNIIRDAGFTSSRWGGCDANWYIWDQCYIGNDSGYWGKGCDSTWEFYNCTIALGEKGLLDDIFNSTQQWNATMVEFTTQVSNNGTVATPSHHVNGSYSASFVNYTNINQSWNITYWEIGNEVYAGNQYGDDSNATRFGEEFIEHCTAMKEVDPTIKCGLPITEIASIDDAGNNWNIELMRVAGNVSDYFVDHPYEGSNLPTTSTYFQEEEYLIIIPRDGNYTFGFYAMAAGADITLTVVDVEETLIDQTFTGFTYDDNGQVYLLAETAPTYIKRGQKTMTITKESGGNAFLGAPFFEERGGEANLSWDDNTHALFYCDYNNDLNCSSRNGNGSVLSWDNTSGDVNFKPGKFDEGVKVTGYYTNGHIMYNVTDNINFTEGAISLWIADTVIDGDVQFKEGGEKYFFVYGIDWNNQTIQLLKGTGPNNNIVFRAYDYIGYYGGTSSDVSFPSNDSTTGANMTEGRWYHILAQWDCSTTEIYLDGVLMDDDIEDKCNIEDWGWSNFTVGGWDDGGGVTNMTIDEFTIWNRKLTSTEIKDLAGRRFNAMNVTNYTLKIENMASPNEQMYHDLENITATAALYVNHTSKIHATEWLCHPSTLYYPGWGDWGTRMFICDGISNALHLHAFMTNASFEAAHAWIPAVGTGRNPSTFFWKDLNRTTPQYWVMNMFTSHGGPNFLDTQIHNSFNFTYEDSDTDLTVNYINVVTTKSEDNNKMYMNIINSEDKNRTVLINLSGGFLFNPNVTVYTLKGDSYEDRNQYDEHIVKLTSNITVLGTEFEYTLPGISIVILEFRNECSEPQTNQDWIIIDQNCSWSSRNIDIGTGSLSCVNCIINFEDINITVDDWSVENGMITLTPPFKFASR
jgi:concanavalin A-like lectin/glucanase superfamily protein